MSADAQNPWLGLVPYGESDAPFFHGRAGEAEELLALIERDTLSVLYGVSGLGKTSLIRAGVLPRLRLGESAPIYLRLRHDVESAFAARRLRYAGEQDAFMSSSSPFSHFEGATIAVANNSGNLLRPLLRFDLSSFAGTYSDISSVTLTLSIGDVDFGTNTANLHEVSALNGDWVATSFNWNTKNGTTAWDGGGGLGATGYGPTLASQSWTSTTPALVFTITGTAALNLINDFTTGNNEGFIVTASNETSGSSTYYFAADTYATASARPQLSITYAPTPEPSSAFLLVGALAGFSQCRIRENRR